MLGLGNLVLAGKQIGNLHRKGADALPGCINDVPIMLHVSSFLLKSALVSFLLSRIHNPAIVRARVSACQPGMISRSGL
jgi:hypothetical protein